MARRSRPLMDELGAGLLPEPEFRTILAAHFREITQPAPQVITYGRNDETALLARYKDGRLRRLEAGPALKPDDINAVAARVRAEAAETREHVHRSIVFSPRRPAGFWRFADRFQLLPAPPSAPDTLGLAPHPLVLEFKVRWSADTTLSTMRWTDTETRLVLLLNALLRFGLTHTGFRTRQQWVIAMEHPDGHPAPVTTRTIYAHDGYAFRTSRRPPRTSAIRATCRRSRRYHPASRTPQTSRRRCKSPATSNRGLPAITRSRGPTETFSAGPFTGSRTRAPSTRPRFPPRSPRWSRPSRP